MYVNMLRMNPAVVERRQFRPLWVDDFRAAAQLGGEDVGERWTNETTCVLLGGNVCCRSV